MSLRLVQDKAFAHTAHYIVHSFVFNQARQNYDPRVLAFPFPFSSSRWVVIFREAVIMFSTFNLHKLST